MSAPTQDVDWAAVERRGRRQAWLVPVALPLLLTAATARNDLLDGVGWRARAVVLAVLTLGLVAAVAHQQRPARRVRADEAVRVQYAVQHHVDPGPALRERADRQARYLDRVRWLWLGYPLMSLAFLEPAA